MREDEKRLLLRIYTADLWPRHAGAENHMPPKRVRYLCEKWGEKGWYEWGTTIDLGWLTEKGKAYVEAELLEQGKKK